MKRLQLFIGTGLETPPPAFRPKYNVFLRNRGRWFRICSWFAYYWGKVQFMAENPLPFACRPKIIVFLRNRGCWFRIWFWFSRKSFSFGDIAIYLNNSDIHFAISSNKINIYLQLNDSFVLLFEEIAKCMSLLFK